MDTFLVDSLIIQQGFPAAKQTKRDRSFKGSDHDASKLRKIYVMVGCAMRTKMPTGRYLHGAHGAPYFDKTLNLLA